MFMWQDDNKAMLFCCNDTFIFLINKMFIDLNDIVLLCMMLLFVKILTALVIMILLIVNVKLVCFM